MARHIIQEVLRNTLLNWARSKNIELLLHFNTRILLKSNKTDSKDSAKRRDIIS